MNFTRLFGLSLATVRSKLGKEPWQVTQVGMHEVKMRITPVFPPHAMGVSGRWVDEASAEAGRQGLLICYEAGKVHLGQEAWVDSTEPLGTRLS